MSSYKDKKTKTWLAMFYYTDQNNVRKRKAKRGFLTKKEAQEWEHEFLVKNKRSLEMDFCSFYEVYMRDRKPRLRTSTYLSKQGLIEHLILPFFSSMPINEIKAPDIIQWQNSILIKGFKPTYIKTINNQLVAIFNHAVNYYDLPKNPCHKVGSIGKKNADEMLFWTYTEYSQFIEVVEEPFYNTLFQVFYWTGIRLGELLALTKEDIHLKSNILDINKSVQTIKGELVVTEPKTPKSKRKIPMPKFLCEQLKQHIATIYGATDVTRVFPSSKAGISRNLAKYATLANVKKIRTHDLRHSHASLLIEEGFQPMIIRDRLGHEKIETTLTTYAHLYPNKGLEVAKRLDEIAIKKSVPAGSKNEI